MPATAPALLMYADPARSMDLFHAVPASIIDPFLYVEAEGRRVAVLPEHDHASVRAVDEGIECLDVFAFGRRELMEAGASYLEAALEVARRACERLGVREAAVNWDFPVALADRLRDGGVPVRVDARRFEARRRVKTRLQVDGIRRAQHAADLAMARAAELIREARPGLTAEEVRAAMQAVCEAHDATLDDDVIVAPGPQAALGHESGSGPIRPGEHVLVDIWPRDRASRCWADMTRTFMAGAAEPPAELVEYWSLARAALDTVLAQVRPGVNGKDLHVAASAVFERAGKPTQRTMPAEPPPPDHGFLHALGHGVGLEVHEAPGLGLAGDDLVAGDVIAVEPGCYRKGFGGVRLEDLLLVTDDGAEVLTDFPYDL